MLATLPVDSSWINKETAAEDASESAPFDGDYWRVLVQTDREKAVGFVRGYMDCALRLTKAQSGLRERKPDVVVEEVSGWYGLDSQTGEVDSARAGYALAKVIEALMRQPQ